MLTRSWLLIREEAYLYIGLYFIFRLFLLNCVISKPIKKNDYTIVNISISLVNVRIMLSIESNSIRGYIDYIIILGKMNCSKAGMLNINITTASSSSCQNHITLSLTIKSLTDLIMHMPIRINLIRFASGLVINLLYSFQSFRIMLKYYDCFCSRFFSPFSQ